MLREDLIQKAGEIIMNKYDMYYDVPDKYKFLYKNFEPLKIGNKRPLENDDDY